MILEKDTLITLDDNNKYFVFDTFNYENLNYAWLVHEVDKKKYIFCEVENENNNIKLNVIKDPQQQEFLLIKFIERLNIELSSELN